MALAGLLVGLVFGWAAQRSRFCLRAAVVEFAQGTFGPRLSVWLLTFSTALFWTQGLVALGLLDLGESRWLAQPGSISGAILGGLIFGAGMVLARGCPGRLLVLAATGNLRALLSGLVFAVIAQMTLRGVLSPLRAELAQALVTEGPNPEITAMLGFGQWAGLALGATAALAALVIARRNRVSARTLVFGSGVGFAAVLGWVLTYQLSLSSFEPVAVESLTFSGPAADMLMFFLLPDQGLDFDVGLISGVAAGAFLAATLGHELKWQGWQGARSMRRYLTGAGMMGFGAMLAGGCSIGAGVTGGSTLALTAWIALTAMWTGGAATDLLVDRGQRAAGIAA
ncbi:MAG TPA: YeeE/YedE family protein [Thermohalobaculum sp.]|nr:YeeE/YedE family protein [Thermohalobaculum sp.]